MQRNQVQRALRLLSLLLCTVLIAAMALLATGCDNEQAGGEETPAQTTAPTPTVTVRGEGSTAFFFHVTDPSGAETRFEIHTDKTVVGDALQELGLIAGEEGAYGLYVKTVNGVTVDYASDGKYWAFYVNGAYAASGVDVTEIMAGATYAFRAE